MSPFVRLLVRSACVAGYNRQPRTHAPALLHYLITSQQLAVRRTRKQNKIVISTKIEYNGIFHLPALKIEDEQKY